MGKEAGVIWEMDEEKNPDKDENQIWARLKGGFPAYRL